MKNDEKDTQNEERVEVAISEVTHDMHINVCEWCADWYGDYPLQNVANLVEPPFGSSRVFRGGSWCSDASSCYSSNRNNRYPPNITRDYLGFRVALDE